jgi:hypothetical protein
MFDQVGYSDQGYCNKVKPNSIFQWQWKNSPTYNLWSKSSNKNVGTISISTTVVISIKFKMHLHNMNEREQDLFWHISWLQKSNFTECHMAELVACMPMNLNEGGLKLCRAKKCFFRTLSEFDGLHWWLKLTNFTHVSHGFDTLITIQYNMLKSSCNLGHLKKIRSQVSKLDHIYSYHETHNNK